MKVQGECHHKKGNTINLFHHLNEKHPVEYNASQQILRGELDSLSEFETKNMFQGLWSDDQISWYIYCIVYRDIA